MEFKSHKPYTISDSPISSIEHDYLNVSDRYINKIYSLLSSDSSSSFTIAITGEWGVGKTSTMNLIEERLRTNDKNIIVKFDPMLEGKLETVEIIELFYLKLFKSIRKPNECKEIFKKILSSIGAMAFKGTKMKASLPLPDSEAYFDLGEKYERVLEIWESESSSLSLKKDELDRYLKKNEFRVYLFIDEIDRLTPENTIKFLIFTRIIESFENVFCIIGIDYQKTLANIKNCQAYGGNNYNISKAYLDKLFHTRFHISHYKKGLEEFALNEIRSIGSHLPEKVMKEVRELSGYLKTPRQIKKWATSAISNKEILEFCLECDTIRLLKLMAVCIKHPIILKNIENNTLNLIKRLRPLNGNINNAIKKYIGRSLTEDYIYKESEILIELLLKSTGIKSEYIEIDFNIDEYIEDVETRNVLKDVLPSISLSTFTFFIYGSKSDYERRVVHDYLNGETERSILFLSNYENNKCELIALDLNKALCNHNFFPNKSVSIGAINTLWKKKKCTYGFDSSNPYKIPIFSCLSKHYIEDIIEKCDIVISNYYIDSILEYKAEIKRDVNKNELHEIRFRAACTKNNNIDEHKKKDEILFFHNTIDGTWSIYDGSQDVVLSKIDIIPYYEEELHNILFGIEYGNISEMDDNTQLALKKIYEIYCHDISKAGCHKNSFLKELKMKNSNKPINDFNNEDIKSILVRWIKRVESFLLDFYSLYEEKSINVIIRGYMKKSRIIGANGKQNLMHFVNHMENSEMFDDLYKNNIKRTVLLICKEFEKNNMVLAMRSNVPCTFFSKEKAFNGDNNQNRCQQNFTYGKNTIK